MVSTIIKKSWKDLKNHRSRSILTIIVVALGVIAMSLFAVIPLINQGIADEIDNSQMYDVRASMNNVELNDTNFEELEEIDNIRHAEGKFHFFTRIYIGARRNDALFVGVKDFQNQHVDVVKKDTGEYPGQMQVLTDSGNSRNNLYHGDIDDNVRVFNYNGTVIDLEITGKGRTLSYDYSAWGVAVFYTNLETVYQLSNGSGFNLLGFDLDSATQDKAEKAVIDIRNYLSENTNFVAYTNLPQTREDGDWPGKEEFTNMGSFFDVLTYVTLFCSFFLVANTMHTVMTEQRREIAQMKAVGATKGQIIRSYITTSLIIGVTGSLIGTLAGIFVAFAMASFLASSFFGVVLGLMIHPQTMLFGFSVGVGLTLLATLPSLLLSLRTTVREGMENTKISSNYGSGITDKLLMRTSWLPRSTQMGLRNISRKKGRSASLITLVAIAVGILLAVLAIGASMDATVSGEFENFTWDIMISGQPESGKPLTDDVEYILEEIEGVKSAEPFVFTQARYNDFDVWCYGYRYDTKAYDLDAVMYKGRWFDLNEQVNGENVLVISKTLAKENDVDIGDTIKLDTATGKHNFTVVGVHSGQMFNGMTGFMPVTTSQEILRWNNTVSGFSIITNSDSHDLIDKTSTRIEDELMKNGYVVGTEIKYVMEEINRQFIRMVGNLFIAVGSLVIFITMIGLMSTLTMNIMDRTKEIGMMRCIGSRAGHIRWIFGTEGTVMALFGWLIGIPVGFALGQYLANMMYELIHIDLTYVFPMNLILWTFLVTLGITILVIQPSLWKATHLKPGDALRYE
jgi:putative ABC transport system permease protein